MTARTRWWVSRVAWTLSLLKMRLMRFSTALCVIHRVDADGRELIADLACGADALRGVGGRHPDVDDRHVGVVLLDGRRIGLPG
jgi:hypothetical protein